MMRLIRKTDRNLTETQLINVVNFLLLFASISMFNGLLCLPYAIDDHKQVFDDYTAKDFHTPVPTVAWWATPKKPVKEPNFAISSEAELRNRWQNINLKYSYLKISYLCRGYITAYSDQETGYSGTASGVTVHYSYDNTEPTTVAIDRRYFKFGDLFYIDGKLYIAEDTGSAVTGMHWDVYRETLEEVQSFGSHYTDVYTAEYTSATILEAEHRSMHECWIIIFHKINLGEAPPPYKEIY